MVEFKDDGTATTPGKLRENRDAESAVVADLVAVELDDAGLNLNAKRLPILARIYGAVVLLDGLATLPIMVISILYAVREILDGHVHVDAMSLTFILSAIHAVVLVVSAACLIVFGVMKWLDVYTRHGEAVVVPDVKGMTVDEASKMFRNHGLVCVVSDSNYVKNKAAGIVLDVNPGAGQKVKEGRTIYLTINTLSIPLRAVPDVADNSSLRQAQAKVLAAGFKLTEIQLMNGEKDWVYGIKYQGRSLNAGDKVPLGAALTLMVGNGENEPLESDSMENVEGADEPVSSESPSSQDDSWF